MSSARVSVGIRPLRRGDEAACEHILRSLPEWFGLEAPIVEYVRDLTPEATLVAKVDDAAAGFLTIRRHSPHAAEIRVMAVAPALHGQGVGRSLVRAAETRLAAAGVEYLQVKTLGPARHSPEYERTRGFYEHLGFRRLEETLLWGPENPCLILVRRIA